MSANRNLTQPTKSSQLTRRRFLRFAAALPFAAATCGIGDNIPSERQLLAALVGDSGVLRYTDKQIAVITAPSHDPGEEIAHLRTSVEVYEWLAALRRARLAWLEAL